MHGEEEVKQYVDKLIKVNRVANVVKGGRRFSFSALVVVGNGKGNIGMGLGKANQVPDAVRKAVDAATKQAKSSAPIGINDNTIFHDIQVKYGSASLLMKPMKAGGGIVASTIIREICTIAGIKDIQAKSLGSNNPTSLVRAIFAALRSQKDVNEIKAMRMMK